MSTLEVGLDNLSTVDYQDKLEAIARTLKKTDKLLTLKPHSITFDIDKLADKVAEQFATSNRYPFENKDGTIYASIHMPTTDKKEAFSRQLERLIIQELRNYFQQALLQASLEQRSIEQYATNLLKPISEFSVSNFSSRTATDLKYTLGRQISFEKQRLHLRPRQSDTQPWLQGHKLTIQVNDIQAFDQQLIEGICNFLRLRQVEDDEIEDARETLQIMAKKEDSPFSQLRSIVVKESLARIQRTARIQYLEYLYSAMKARKVTNKEKLDGLRLLKSLILRLRCIGDYIQREDDGHYQVAYQGSRVNLRDLFSRADAFDPLPIITEVEGSLGESTDYLQGAKTFVNGLKLKLNGPVQIHGGNGQPVFEYNLALLDPTSNAYQQREAETLSKIHFHERVLRVALLYYFVFVKMEDLAYQPAADFEDEILNVLRTGSEAEKTTALQQLRRKIEQSAPRHLRLLKDALVEFLDLPNSGPARREETLTLSLKDDVLVKDVDSMLTHSIFFQDSITTNNGKDALKYIVVEGAHASQDALCKLPIHLIFEPIYYYEADDACESFTMTYETQGIQVLPVFLAPVDNEAMIARYKDAFKQSTLVVFRYRHHPEVHPDSERAFMYRFTYQLIAYVFLKLLADSITVYEKRKLFFPIVCLHAQQKAADEQHRKYDDEEFMHALSKVLAHLLAQDYSANSQGFHLNTIRAQGDDIHKLSSALYSLYSALPRLFQLPKAAQASSSPAEIPRRQLDKLAVIVVSSRKCDLNNKTPDFYQLTVYGEVVGIERLANGQVRVGTLSTFSINQPAQIMYEQPTAILAQVKTCYAQGYRHFLYVARAPYSRTLHISDRQSTEDLFFMRKEVIQAIREIGPGIKVYPVFCDKYYVVNQRRKERKNRLAVDSLYVDDLGELAQLASDRSRRALIFLNLFSGATISPSSVYNGVMSYSTLINVYENDPTYDQYIWADLLSENIPQSLKGDLIDFITLLHFSRYEKPREFGFKLDPYTRIIGDTCIGKVAVFPNMKGNVRFNSLAFLTLVRAVLHKEL
jgi:hypothetical protein